MPRRAALPYDKEQLDAAIRHFNDGGKSRREIAKMYGVPESTLRDHTGNGPYTGYDTTNGPALSLLPEEEDALESYIVYMADRGFPLKRCHIKSLACDILKESGRQTLINLERGPSDKWMRNFMARHSNLRERKADVLDRDRAEVEFKAITGFYDLLSKTLQETGLSGKPERIFNVDETGLSGKQSVRGKVVVKKGTRHPHQRVVSFPGHTTVLASISADGSVQPPLIIFEKSMPAGDLQVPGDWMISSSETGYISTDLFLLWLERGFARHCGKDRPVLLIMDNHVSHVSAGVIKFAKANLIELLFLPSHSTHLLQPLDVGYFGQFKEEVGKRSIGLGYAGMRSVPKAKLPKFLHHAMNAMSRDVVTGAFAHSGIHPFDPSKVGPESCKSAEIVPQPMQEDICVECGNPRENPLVKMGIIPQSLASILLPPPQPPKRRRRKDCLSEARLVTARELSEDLGPANDKANSLKKAEQPITNNKVQPNSPSDTQPSKRKTAKKLSSENQLPKRKTGKKSSKTVKPMSQSLTPSQIISDQNECAEPCDDEEHGICHVCMTSGQGNWVGCDVCPAWYHEHCLPVRERKAATLSVKRGNKWLCNVCLQQEE